MESPPTATATRDAAFLAHVLADALKLGLPDPDYITMSPSHAGSTVTSAVSFQFNHQHGHDPLPRLYAWADRFGVDVRVSAGTVHPSSTWHKFEFTHAGVLFDAYAQIEAAECAECGRFVCDCADDMGEDATDSIASDEAAAVLAASIASGQPLVISDSTIAQARYFAEHPLDDELAAARAAAPEVCGLPVFGDPDRLCSLFSDHEPMPGCGSRKERAS